MNDKPYGLSKLVRCLENYEKIYGDIPVRFIDNDGNINDIFNIDLGSIVLEVEEEELFYDEYYTVTKHINSNAVNLRSTFDYSTLKKEEENDNEDQ